MMEDTQRKRTVRLDSNGRVFMPELNHEEDYVVEMLGNGSFVISPRLVRSHFELWMDSVLPDNFKSVSRSDQGWVKADAELAEIAHRDRSSG